MQEALSRLDKRGAQIDAADIARWSPISWRHINFLGQHEFQLPEAVVSGGLRPLRENTFEWDF